MFSFIVSPAATAPAAGVLFPGGRSERYLRNTSREFLQICLKCDELLRCESESVHY